MSVVSCAGPGMADFMNTTRLRLLCSIFLFELGFGRERETGMLFNSVGTTTEKIVDSVRCGVSLPIFRFLIISDV